MSNDRRSFDTAYGLCAIAAARYPGSSEQDEGEGTFTPLSGPLEAGRKKRMTGLDMKLHDDGSWPCQHLDASGNVAQTTHLSLELEETAAAGLSPSARRRYFGAPTVPRCGASGWNRGSRGLILIGVLSNGRHHRFIALVRCGTLTGLSVRCGSGCPT